MTISILNFLWIFLFNKSIFGFRLDTSYLPFSILARFGLFYQIDFWFNSRIDYDKVHCRTNKIYDIAIPYICDITFIKEVTKYDG